MIRKFVLTGPCCSGKTTIINLLKEMNYKTIHEVPREIISDEIKNNNKFSLETNEEFLRFQYKIIKRQLELEKKCLVKDYFLDRGVIDSLGYIINRNILIPQEILNVGLEQRYSKIFFLELLKPKHYINDNERTEKYSEALKLQDSLLKAYNLMGYDPIFISNNLDPNERLEFILNQSQ